MLINVNFPDLPPEQVTEVETTFQGRRDQHIVYADKRTDPRGGAYFWLGFRGMLSNPPQGSDLRAIYEGRISVTPLPVDLTHDGDHPRAEGRARRRAAQGGVRP